MSDADTKRMIAAYLEEKEPTGFFSSFFRSPPQNFHNTRKVEIDIVRSEEDVSIVITDATGYRLNSADKFTNKEFEPPTHKEAAVVNADELLDRSPGDNPFADVSFQSRLTTKVMQAFRKPERKIRRAIELQASQVMQTGTVDLKDGAGVTLFSIDYSPKATHFPTAAVAWDTASDKLGDLRILCDLIREDGKASANMAIFGDDAWELFRQDTNVQALLDNRRINVGEIRPQGMPEDATFQGSIAVGDCRLELWTYGGRYKDPQTGNPTRFMASDKVVVRASSGRMDATFGAIPRLVAPDPRVLPFLPSRISDVGGGLDMFPNGWFDLQGENLTVGVGSKPLMIPTAIDTFGCLDINI